MSYKYDVSVLMPAIRTHQWLMMYGSLFNACKEHTWELVLVSPFDLPPEMTHFDNVKLIKDYGAPTRAAQIGALQCEGEYMYHGKTLSTCDIAKAHCIRDKHFQ